LQISASEAFAKRKISRFFRSFREYFRHAERNYFRHCQKLRTSQQRQRPIQYAHARDLTMAAAGRAHGPTQAAPGIIVFVCFLPSVGIFQMEFKN